MVGILAMSKAGHDKGTLYVIIREEGEYVYLADGRIRTADRPKKKNKKHVQMIKQKKIAEPESGFDDGFAFGFRADTAQYSYLIRLNPYKEEENLSLYCYRRDSLECHMKQAEKGIRFITPHYEEKFRIADGDMVRIRCPDGRQLDRECRYIDECHVEVGKGWDNLYHICQFAEMMERNGNSVIPLRNSLPLICYGKVPEKRAIVMFERGFDGYRSASAVTRGRTSQKLVDELNSGMGVSKAQAAAMLAGATQGWATPAADPKNYNEQGQPIKPRHRDRGDAR